MLRAAVVAAMLATAYCGAKGPPQPPVREAPDAGSTGSTPTPDSGSGGPPTPTGSADAGPP